MIIIITLFLIAAIFQILFLGIFSRMLGFRAKKSIHQPSVSVIVCSRNEYHNLQYLIPLLTKQHYPTYEIIIVNDRSDDHSRSFLTKEAEKYPHLKVINIEKTEKGFNPKKYALIQGIKESTHDIILLTDADCLPHPTDWIASMIENMNDKQTIVLGFSPYTKEKSLLNALIQFETLYTAIQYFSFTILGIPYMGVGRNLAYRKDIFLKKNDFGKFNQVTGGDDDLWVQQVAHAKNVAVAIDNQKSFVNSIPKKTWASYFKQKTRHVSVSRHYKFSHKLLLGLLHLSHFLFWICAFILLIKSFSNSISYSIFTIFVVRELFLVYIYKSIANKLKVKLSIFSILFFDLFFMLYIMIVGVCASFIKKIQWKT